MIRFEHALNAATAPCEVTLSILARQLADAVEQVEAEGTDPVDDPAVLLLGAFIAFHTHADVNTARGYHQLIHLCHERIHAAPCTH